MTESARVLRPEAEFVRAAEVAGLTTVSAHVWPKPELFAEVAALRPSQRSKAYALDEFAATSIDVVAGKAA